MQRKDKERKKQRCIKKDERGLSSSESCFDYILIPEEKFCFNPQGQWDKRSWSPFRKIKFIMA